MKICVLSIYLTFCSLFVLAQSTDELAETARNFSRQGDYGNAILVLNRALAQSPRNLPIQKELAFNLYLQRDYKRAKETIMPLTNRSDADESTFQIAANILKALEDLKELDKLYKKGLKKLPGSGPLNSEYGELLYAKQDYSAIKFWEKGIELDPSYPMNYYHAAKYYFFTTEKVWGILFAEMFINLESYTQKTIEMKGLLSEGYKKLFSETDLGKAGGKKPFSEAFLQVMQQQSAVISKGVRTETISMLRTRFILQWFHEFGHKLPFRLFDYHRQLLREGLFDAYNQWIFAAADNLANYQNWIQTHPEESERFVNFQKSVLFKVPEGQFYR